MSPDQARAAAEFQAVRGEVPFGPFAPLLYSPGLMTAARAMGDYLRFRSALPPRLSELAILVAARAWTQQFEWHVHAPLALAAGVAPAVVEAIAQGRRPRDMAEDEEALYDFCSELHQHGSVSDATYDRAVASLGQRGVVDAIGIAGYYTLLAMVLNTARVPPPGSRAPALDPFPS